jgi:pyruvate/2-oxoglutarate dehydrogenase complex dihydrolipoamide dehydrogenase (E3) component
VCLLEDIGVTIMLGVKVQRVNGSRGQFAVIIEGHPPTVSTHVIVAIGKAPRLRSIGLESVGLDPARVCVDDHGRLGGLNNLWAVGDVTGIAPYTHGANSQATVVCDNINGGDSSIRAAIIPRCVYTHPPVVSVGQSTINTDVLVSDSPVSSCVHYSELARPATDDLGDGHLVVLADRYTGAVIGASGIGAGMDELISQLAFAIETKWSVERLAKLVQPFPTVSEIVGVAYSRLADERQLSSHDDGTS